MPHAGRAARAAHAPDQSGPWWARWSVPLALTWSALAIAVALGWAGGLLPTPFTNPGLVAIGDLLSAFDPMVGIALTLLLGAVGVGWVVVAPRLRGAPGRQAALMVGWLLAAVTGLGMLSGHLLAMLGYTPVTLVLGWFLPDLWAGYLAALATPDTLFQTLVLAGALIWGATLLSYGRSVRGACADCGRHEDWSPEREERTRRRALRTGRVAVAIAVSCALVYPAMRLPWLFGIPVGMDDAAWAEIQASPDRLAVGVGLGSAGLVGAVLVLGLVRNWGVRFPRWMVGLSGRRVPVALAVVPASIVALTFVAIGRGFVVAIVTDQLNTPIGTAWEHVAAFVLMLPYGIALLVAAAAYATRRRAACDTCAQGLPETPPR